ncbi:hypothetical protein [Streptomyces sp. OR43]|uniref:hypothetical protein n=1 Tax=Streptomyces sp. or43 TaxID=2478957 RepID=UPI0021C85A46|nr:hypothetical protein [Streptomyces sp. or43]
MTQTEARLSALAPAPSPEHARKAVVDAAVSALRSDGTPIPADIGQRAAAAYTEALAPVAEREALTTAVDSLKRHIVYLRTRHTEPVLATLAGQLNDLMSEVRGILGTHGRIVDGETAIDAGPEAVDAFTRLRAIVNEVDALRATQRNVLRDVVDTGVLNAIYQAGHDQFSDVTLHPLPADVKRVIAGTRRRNVAFLIFAAESGRHWIPTSVDELTADASGAVDIGSADDGSSASSFNH